MDSHKERHPKSSVTTLDAPATVNNNNSSSSTLAHAHVNANRDNHAKNHKTATSSTTNGTANPRPSALPEAAPAAATVNAADRPKPSTESSGAKSDSEAETVVLPGKNGYSPAKVRKTIKHEERSDEEGEVRGHSDVDVNHAASLRRDAAKSLGPNARKGNDGSTASMLGKRKRYKHDNLRDENYAGNSSGLSSVPTSPVHTNRSSLSKRADSDSEASRSSSPRHSTADRAKSSERGPKRRLPHDDDERPRIQRQRSPGLDHSTDRDKVKTKRAQTAPHRESSATAKRSVSPRARHRRSVSTHLAPPNSTNGLSQKKKKVPAPLRSTRDRYSADYHSDDSSASGSPHPRGSRVRSLATPAAESAISPARMPPHKKHRDNIGRTFLARAVAGGDIALVRQRLEEWPDDIDLADNAGNTPLQIAALEGADDIVKLLLDHGCDIHCINNDKDTPLLDAVENGHLEVVKLLLDAGVNPRRGNVNGDEPLDLVNEDADNADEIRKILLAARKKSSEQRRFSDDQIGHDKDDGRSSHGTGSPRHSPPMQPPNASLSGRRATSGRSTKTSNHLLYMPLDSKTLRAAAGKGDEETVIRILQVRDGLDDSESLVLAARGGHDNVINLLLGLGGANPDPPPVKSMPSDVATPILAAIGRDNLDVIKLLLGQAKFDATRKTNGETYYEIARRRAGPRWREEEELLKEAYQAQIKKKKKSATKQSPESKRDMERKFNRSENGSSISTVHKRKTSAEQSASEPPAKKSSVADPKSDRPKSISSTKQNESALSKEKELKRGPGRPRKEERPSSTNASDSESAPLGPPKSSAKPPKRSDSEAAMTSETEAHKPRRKLVSGKDLKGERDKQRRASITSTSSTTSAKDRERPTIRENLNPDVSRSIIPRSSSDPELVNDKSLDRARKLKRDDSRNRLSAIRGDSPIKRPRSRTPPRSESQDSAARKLDENGQVKRRRLDSEQRLNSSPDRKLEKKAAIDKSSTKDRDVSMTDAPSSDHQDRPVKSKEHRLNTEASSSKIPKRDDQERKHLESRKLEDEAKQERTSELKAAREAAREAKLQEKRQGEVRVKKEPDDDDKKTRKDDDERRRRKEEDEQRRKRKEQEEEKRRLEDEKRARLAKEKAKEEKAGKAREEEEKRKQDEAREAREAKRKEEEAKRRADEVRRQQEEAEAREKKLKAEAEARQREEEERKRLYLEQQRLKNEEMERRREQRIREQRLEQQRLLREREEARLAKLPPLLRWFDTNSQPATPEIASYFCRMQGVRFDTINPDASGTADGRDQWLLNTQVALLLGEKDLQLTRYTAWPRYPASELAKRALWRVESDRYALTSSELCDFGDGRVSFREAEKVKEQSLPLFLSLDLFFVKLSDFMFIVPKFPHLRNLKMTVEYRELPPNPSFLNKWAFPPKWKDDSADDGAVKFAPESKTYLNGTLERKSRPSLATPSKKPFPEQRIPRRGFAPVPPDDPEYESLCREQGLSHLLSNSAQTNGLAPVKPHLNGMSPPDSDISLNDDAYASAVKPKSEEAHGLSNGINGVW